MIVLIVPDKFKGTLTAHAATELIAQGWATERPEDQLVKLPMSDGGDGFGEVMAELLGLETRMTQTVDAAHRPINARWWCAPDARSAVIESAQVVGLASLPPGEFHPFALDTFGLGAVLADARRRGVEEMLIGIGGSATNDGGFGVARALGWQFLDAHQQEITSWTRLGELSSLQRPVKPVGGPSVHVAVDVQNPFLGAQGASRIYGPQKGLRECDFPKADECLGKLAEVTGRELDLPGVAEEPGTGSAGGLGFGLRCFLNGKLESGFGLFSGHANLEARIRSADLVITGEGAIDHSTLMGKGAGEVATLCRKLGVPCLGLGGTLLLSEQDATGAKLFHTLHGIVPELASSAEAKANPQHWLPRLATHAAREWNGGKPLHAAQPV